MSTFPSMLGGVGFGRRFWPRSIHIAKTNMINPITPRETPRPIPTFAPNERSPDGVEVDDGKAVEEVVDVIALEVAVEVVEAEVDVVVVVALARLTFHPTTAIAPTVLAWVKVVVMIVQ